jgi:zinc transporter ZupT
MENAQHTHDTEARGASMTARMWTVFIIGIIIGFGGYYLWDNRSTNDDGGKHLGGNTEEQLGGEEGADDTATSTKPSINDILAVSATVGEQPEGLHVFLNSVSTDRTVWIAVQEDNDGELGNILGAALVSEGSHDGLWVELLRNTEAGHIYYITAYAENGDGVFDHETDALLPGPNSDNVIGSFAAIRI